MHSIERRRCTLQSRRSRASVALLVLLCTGSLTIALVALAVPRATVRDQFYSREFWSQVNSGRQFVEVESYSSLASMVEAADVVVLASMIDLERSRIVGDVGEVEYARVNVQVDEFLKDTQSRAESSTLALEVMTPAGAGDAWYVQQQTLMPLPEGILFLRDKEMEARRLGLTDEVSSQETGFYRLVIMRASLHNQSGRVESLSGDEPDFLSRLHGTSFAELVSNIRAMGEADASSP